MNILKRWALRFALKVLGEGHQALNFQQLEHRNVKVGAVRDWLFSNLNNDGWGNYYSWRNYSLLESAGHMKDPQEHILIVGRLLELRMLKIEIEEVAKGKQQAAKTESLKKEREKTKTKIR